jgi:hypothetical protein
MVPQTVLVMNLFSSLVAHALVVDKRMHDSNVLEQQVAPPTTPSIGREPGRSKL